MRRFEFSRILNFNIEENLTKMDIYIGKELKEKQVKYYFSR